MRKQVMCKTRLAGNEECKVLYHQEKDLVELEVGGTSLKLAASNFFMINEMMRKAAAKLVMQTELKMGLPDVELEDQAPLGKHFYLGELSLHNVLAIPA